MAIFKCKMCGGTLEINNNETVAICEYCGTKQTLPKLDDDKKANLYDRANHFRRNNEFDKAMDIYYQILNEDNTDAEAYWSLVLCKYGIEYVEDPATHKRVPTVNRAQFTSVFADEDYKSALKYADGYQRDVYEAEAKAIDEIQKGILEISSKEEPFDVFICYKETDNNGRRTPDSVLANELYHQLVQEGFKVFFSRITLEDKLGTAYEPYIFAALNSSKVMVVLGTKPEYFNAVWVKNEWNRYLALIKNGAKKMLIPAYKDMDPYDLPEEFSHLQAQDMNKLGFMQDLIRGIKKIVQTDEPKATTNETVVINGGNASIEPLLKRAFMFLEDGDWDSADEYCEKVLDQDPENAQAYLGKLMAELKARTQDELKNQEKPFDDKNNYQKALRFGDDKLNEPLKEYINYINVRNENERLEGIYTSTKEMMKGKDISEYELAIKQFESILAWKDSVEQIDICRAKIEELKAKEETERLERERKAEIKRIEAEKKAKKIRRLAITLTPVVCGVIAFIIILNIVIIPNLQYNKAVALMEAENYIDAYESFISLDGYRDSLEKANYVHDKYKTEKLKNPKVGDYVIFGSYEQDNDTSNGKEDIEWLVLDVKNGKTLVISKYALGCKRYDTQAYGGVESTWETCNIRYWLNNYFINEAFSDSEKAMIPTVTVSADKNPKYDSDQGNDTKDKVFLLSIIEVNKYFSSNDDRTCQTTNYADPKGVNANKSNGNCWWWLRTRGIVSSEVFISEVLNDGSVYEDGGLANSDHGGVRPALWIEIS